MREAAGREQCAFLAINTKAKIPNEYALDVLSFLFYVINK